jgi:hypothetical protein
MLDVEEEWSKEIARIDDKDVDFSAYNGNIYTDIESEKRTFKHRKGNEQSRRAMGLYRVIKRFFIDIRPDFALLPPVEGVDGKIFAAVAREFGIPLMVPVSCRNIGGFFFAEDANETVPHYARADEASLVLSRDFLQKFRECPVPAVIDIQHVGLLPDFRLPFLQRALRGVARWWRYASLIEWDWLRTSFLYNLPFLRDAIRGMCAYRNQKFAQISSIDELPEKFIYYPLQYTPEASINAPAPYFVDQFRAIDLIRFAMPNDTLLVVKEHPACLSMRSPAFLRQLRRKAGVIFASSHMDSMELIRRAELTISVTGTATFEAFLSGCPSITLGTNLVAKYIGGVTPISALKERILNLCGKTIPDEAVISGLAELFSVRYEIVFKTPGEAKEPVLRTSNIQAILHALRRHISLCTFDKSNV